MKKFLKIAAIVLLVLVGVAYLLPRHIKVQREKVLAANISNTFDAVNDLKKWGMWSPWHQLDSNMKITWGDKTAGVGSSYTWTSEHKNVGNGKLTITESKTNEFIKTEMDFMENGKGTGTFEFSSKGDSTMVKWTMESDMGMNPIGRYFGLFMDKMVGADFEKGLNGLEKFAQTSSVEGSSSALNPEIVNVPAFHVLAIMEKMKITEFEQKYTQCYGEIGAEMQKQKLEMTGAPYGMFYTWVPTGASDVEAGIPVSALGKDAGRVKAKTYPAQKAVMVHFFGPYEASEKAHDAIKKYIVDNKLEMAGASWESYVNDPTTVSDPSKIQTDVYYPVK